MRHSLADLFAEDRLVLGTWNQIAAPEIIDLIGFNGFDFAVIDCEHGPFGIETAESLGRACDAVGIAPAVRVARNDPVEIMKALDAGLSHVVVPQIASGADAARAVSATRFAPVGLRGACPCVRSAGHFTRDWSRYARDEEGRTGVIALVETAAAVADFEGIATTDGLAGVMFGPFDLSVSMGLGGDWRAPAVADALARMVERTLEAGRVPIVPVFSPDADECSALVAEWRARGVRVFLIGSDKILIATTFHGWTSALAAPAT